MAFITADRVKDTSTTTGTGNITVSGSAPFGYRTFSTVLSVSDTFYYAIQGQSTSEWEVGLGTYASTNQFARTTVLASSASGSAVSFSSGTKNVFITLAATKTLQLDASGNPVFTGVLAIANGGTNSTATPTAGTVPYGTGTAIAYSAAGTAGQVLTSGGAGAPTWTTASGTGTVTSVNVSGGTTGLTTSGGPVTGSGTITMAGTLAVANGGTGLTSPGTNGNVLTSNGTAWVSSPAGSGSGTVTSVNISGGTTGLTASGGPITTSGTITLAGTLAVANGGTGVTTSTGSGNNVLSASPTLTGTVTATTITSPSATALTLQYGGTTGVTLDTTGSLLVGTTSGGLAGKISIYHVSSANYGLSIQDTRSTGGDQVAFYNSSGTIVGTIATTASNTSYVTSSDYRLKENVAPMTSGLATIAALKPVTYDWANDKSAGEGFIAHELQSVIPFAVTGEKDAVNENGSIKPQGVDYSKIVVHLVAAIQELSAKNNAFEIRLAALEAK